MKNKTKYLATIIAVFALILGVVSAEGRYQASSASSLTGAATAIPPNPNIVGNAIEVQPNASASPTFVVKDSGDVGIRTASPTQALDVNGGINQSNGIINLGSYASSSTFSVTRLVSPADSYAWQSASSNAMVFNASSKRLGIGTIYPSAHLNIISDNTGDDIVLDGVGSSKARLGIWAGGSFFALQNVTGTNTVLFRSYGDSWFLNNVGIGTASPLTRLHLFSDKIGGNSAVVRTETSQPTTNTGLWMVSPTSSWLIGTNREDIAGASDNLLFYTSSGTGGVKMVINDSGNVGIGTVNPKSMLEVAGSLMIGIPPNGGKRFVHFDKGDLSGSTQVGLSSGDSMHHAVIAYFGPQSAIRPNTLAISQRYDDDISFVTSNGQDRVYINGTNGNVGIGTITPEAKLDVNGNVKLSGGITMKDNNGNNVCLTIQANVGGGGWTPIINGGACP